MESSLEQKTPPLDVDDAKGDAVSKENTVQGEELKHDADVESSSVVLKADKYLGEEVGSGADIGSSNVVSREIEVPRERLESEAASSNAVFQEGKIQGEEPESGDFESSSGASQEFNATGGLENEADPESEGPKISSFVPEATARLSGCTKFLYGLSLLAGTIGTCLTINLEVNGNDGKNAYASHRALYCFILFLACFFFEAARQCMKPKIVPRSQTIAATLIREPSVRQEENRPEIPEHKDKVIQAPTSTDGKTSDALELTSPAYYPKNEEPKKTSSLVEAETITISSSEDVPTSERIVLPSFRQSCFVLLRDLFPCIFLVQSFILFIQNAVEESVTPTLTPYTALAGLVTGYSFGVSIKSEKFKTFSDFIGNYRFEFAFPEHAVFIFLLADFAVFALLFAVTTGSFWEGYNLKQLVDTLLSKSWTRASSPSVEHHTVIEPQTTKQASMVPHIPIAFLTSASGIALTGCSFWALQQAASSLEEISLRDFGALYLVSIGNFAATYPLGVYLGRYLPRRFHTTALTVVTYLLVPFASPELTIPHYILLAGGGLCGGIADFITHDQYQRQLTEMEQQKKRTDVLQRKAQALFDLLSQLHLPNDLLLQQHRQQGHKITLMIKGTLIVIVFVTIILLINDVLEEKPSYVVLSVVQLIAFMTIYIGAFHLLPRWSPCIYTSVSLSSFKQFFYMRSFTLGFLLKIVIALNTQRAIISSVDLFYSNLLTSTAFFVIAVPTFANIFFRRLQGYLPYIPNTQDIEELAAALEPEALHQRIVSGVPRVSCSYHLLKFMQKNRPEAPQGASILSDAPSGEISTLESEIVSFSKEELKPQSSDSDEVSNSNLPMDDSRPPLSHWRPVNSPSSQKVSQTGTIPCVPIAALYAGSSSDPQLTLEVEFDRLYDQAYTRDRLNYALILQVTDAAVRGATVARQFTWGSLPASLSLSISVTSFKL